MITFALLFLLLISLFIAFTEETKIGDKFMCWLFKRFFNEDISKMED